MHTEIEALLALQADDAAIREIEEQIDALSPREAELDRLRQAATEALARARTAVEADEKKMRELQQRITEHRQLHERNVGQLEMVKRMRDATAAISQVEQARRILADEESELQTMQRRLAELRQAVELHQGALTDLERDQLSAREAIAADRISLQERIQVERSKRDGTAQRVSRVLLAKYDRIRTRHRDGAIFPLRGPSCGNCDTAVPMQRRNVMMQRQTIEVCEGCGVLMFSGE